VPRLPWGPLRRCPTCGASYTSEARLCEADGATLVDGTSPAASTRPPAAGARCPLCGEGIVESDGFCSSCGRRALSSRPTPPLVPVGSPLAGGVVVASPGGDEYVVHAAGGATMRVVLGEASVIEREADLLERIGGTGPFPGVSECGVDDVHGSYLAMAAPPPEARPLSEVGSGLTLATAIGVLRALVDAAQVIEKIGFAWEPQRDDVHVRPDGSIKISRVRIPRKLGHGERIDARAVVEAVGPTFVPTPALEGPSRAFRLLLPHVPIPGDAGNSISDVRREIAAVELDLAPPTDDGLRVAGVCDPGLRRPHNEDAFAFATGTTAGERWSVLVVCDGVSSSSHADRASTLAAKTACDTLAQSARAGDVSLEAGSTAVAQAIRAAHVAVCSQPVEVTGEGPPGTTIVVALIWRQRLTVGWVGDSRAYWISGDEAEQITHDHSWAVEAIKRGEVTESEAATSPLSHALTRCLGPLEVADAGERVEAGARRRFAEVEPGIRVRDLPGPGWVVLCSDGFWNYFSTPADVATLVRIGAGAASSARVARRLVNHALARGGQDNVTALVYLHR
jgi:serine/threonine protein phosphatase PrpC